MAHHPCCCRRRPLPRLTAWCSTRRHLRCRTGSIRALPPSRPPGSMRPLTCWKSRAITCCPQLRSAGGTCETAQVDTIELHVLDNPAATRAAGAKPQARWNWRGLADFIAEHWALLLIGLATLLALPWLTARLWHVMIPRWRQRRDIYLASEACAFAGLLTAAWRPRARRVYDALLNWLGRFDPIAPDHTIKALKAAAQDPIAEQQVDALERHLFAPRAGSDDWSVLKLLLALGRTRLRLLRQASRTPAVGSLPARLNPIATAAAARRPGRPIAR